MRPKPLVIFDCDGVLVDSERLAAEVFADLLGQHGFAYTPEDCFRKFRGLSLASCLLLLEEQLLEEQFLEKQRLEKQHQRCLPADFLAQLQTATFARFRESLQPVNGIIDVLDYLDRQQWHYCVASSGDYTKLHFTLGQTNMLHRFSGRLFSAVDVRQGKPAPDLFLHAAQAMGYDTSRCIVIEDSIPGIRAAIAAGMRVCGYRSPAGLGTVQFEDMSELPAILDTLY